MSALQIESNSQSLAANNLNMVLGALESSIPHVWIGRSILAGSLTAFSVTTFLAFFS